MKKFVADFETTVYDGQDNTEVWAAAIINMNAPDETTSVKILHSLPDFMAHIGRLLKEDNLMVYFHNLKFDGSFILHYLINSDYWSENGFDTEQGHKFDKRTKYKIPNGTYSYSISTKGIWYNLAIKNHGHICEFRDSLKLLPFTVEEIGKGFGLKHKKLTMKYEGYRYAGCAITPEEKEYIANDVLVVKEALNFMESQGHEEMTIGACCLKEFKNIYGKKQYKEDFPNLYEIGIDEFVSYGEYIRNAYKGGWCYVVPEKANKVYNKGVTADVNSLYPSMMHSDSGNYYPVGKPTFWQGNIPHEAKIKNRYYFLRVRCRFTVKKDHLPTIQIKGNPLYYGREWLKTSDTRIKGGRTSRYYVDSEGNMRECKPILTLTMTDWELMQKHYDLEDVEILDGCWFETKIGIFDEYINKYAEIKKNSKGAMRQLAKLFLNNLYGKFAANTDSSYKICFLNENGELRQYDMDENEKTPGYIAIGAAITSYARAFTITAAQKNYHGPNKPGFIYADTDSIHCDLDPDELVGAPEHPTEFNHWKYEAEWDFAKFVRAKTYVEHVVKEDRKEVEKPFYNLKCAGMCNKVKDIFIKAVTQDYTDEDLKEADFDKTEIEFIKNGKTWDDFKTGLEIPGNLKAQQVKGGTLLVKKPYKMHASFL